MPAEEKSHSKRTVGASSCAIVSEDERRWRIVDAYQLVEGQAQSVPTVYLKIWRKYASRMDELARHSWACDARQVLQQRIVNGGVAILIERYQNSLCLDLLFGHAVDQSCEMMVKLWVLVGELENW